MNKMKLVGAYEHYGNIAMWDKNSQIRCVCDRYLIDNKKTKNQVALLIEPRCMWPDVYDFIEEHYNEYVYVFTHDSKLLKKLPNAKPILWGNVWVREEQPLKTKLISMVSSDKEYCDLHKERKRIARKYREKIDVFGTIDGGKWVDPSIPLIPYKYSVIIENYIDDIWFSEKLLNCFATKTIPIYYGARDIGEYFDRNGIIVCNDLYELEHEINKILNHKEYFEEIYKRPDIQEHLDKNYELSKQYEKFDEWLYKTYEKEIGGLFNGDIL